MQLSSMVHGSGRDERREAHELHQRRNLQQYFHTQTRAHKPESGIIALPSNPYSNPNHQPVDYTYQPRAPRSPPSPPAEEVNKRLPSISTLLSISDADRVNQGTAGQALQQQTQAQHQPQPTGALQAPESRLDQASLSFGSTIVSNPRMALPPTPPLRPDSVVDGNQSPSTASSINSTMSAPPYYLGSALNNMEPHGQRQTIQTVPTEKRHSVPSQPSVSPYTTSPYTTSPYGSSPGGASTGSYYSPESQIYTSNAMYQQRPLPSNFPPPPVPVPVTSSGAATSNPWQHHHYISASSQAAFPQSQDRYICQTCNKAFSRPSSLRIHNHSHTGEKPFRCPHAGCGKAFSVRSNMKRHERGCHAAAGGAAMHAA